MAICARAILKALHLTASAAFALILSCRPTSGTNDTKDLGYLTSGGAAARQNYKLGGCGAGSTSGETAEAAVTRAMSALPPSMQKSLDAWKVEFVLSPNIRSECSESLKVAAGEANLGNELSALEKMQKACIVKNPSGDTPSYRIFLENKPEAVHNYLLVESFALFFFVLDTLSGEDANRDAELGPILSILRNDKKILASQFIQEMSAKAETQTVVSAYDRIFRTGLFATTSLSENPAFQSLVLSELSDAYFCNAASWEEGKMPQTKAAFKTFAKTYFGDEATRQ